MTNIRQDRDSNQVSLSFKPQPDRMSRRDRTDPLKTITLCLYFQLTLTIILFSVTRAQYCLMLLTYLALIGWSCVHHCGQGGVATFVNYWSNW